MTSKPRGQYGFSSPVAVAAAVLLGAALVVAAYLLLFDSAQDEEERVAGGDGGRAIGSQGHGSTETGGPFDDVERQSLDGKGTAVKGTVILEGVTLSGVSVVAWDDMPERISPSMRSMLEVSSSFFGDSDGATDDLIDEQKKRVGSTPDYRIETGEDGSFAINAIPSETITFGLDHDFYTLSKQSTGPHQWEFEDKTPSLPGFSGKLRARLGAMIKGTVTDAAGFPVKGAVVGVDQEETGSTRGFFGFFSGSGPAYMGKETATDADGAFVLRGVDPGENLYLTVKGVEFAPYRSDNFAALPGETLRRNIKLNPGASILARVVGPDGQLVEEAEVSLCRKDDDSPDQIKRMMRMTGSDLAIEKGRTNEKGEQFFTCLELGEYLLYAASPALLGDEEGRAVLLDREKETVSVELALEWGAAITGIVKDERERAVAGAVLRASPSQRGGDMFSRVNLGAAQSASRQKETVAAEDGTFRLTGLKPDTDYRIIAEAAGYVTAECGKVKSGKEGLALVLGRPGQLEGRVMSALSGKPVKSFKVRITPADEAEAKRQNPFASLPVPSRSQRSANTSSRLLNTVYDSARRNIDKMLQSAPSLTDRLEEFSSKKGRFSLKEIVPGEYFLCVRAEGHTPALTEPILVEKGVTSRQITVTLKADASISGEVKSSDGPVSEAKIRIARNKERTREQNLLLEEARETETDRQGRFSLTGLPAGEYILDARHDEHPDVSTDTVTLSECQDVNNVVIHMPEGAVIRGTALAADGSPLVSENIVCADRFSKMERTDEEGRFEFKGLEEGTYTVRIFSRMTGFMRRGDEDLPGSAKVFVSEGGLQEVVLTEPPLEGVTVRGIVTDKGMPVTSGFISVSLEGGTGSGRINWASGVISRDGNYSVEGVHPGWNRFSIRNSSSSPNDSISLRFEIPDHPEHLLNIALPTGEVSGTVIDSAAGLALNGIRVRMTEEPAAGQGDGRQRMWGGGSRSTHTDSEGAFSFQKVPAGLYRINAEPTRDQTGLHGTGYQDSSLTGIAVAESQSLGGLKIFLQKGGAIEVTAMDSEGHLLNRAYVTAQLAGGRQRQTRRRTGENGTALLLGMEPGEYRLTVSASGMGQSIKEGVRIEAGRIQKVEIVLEKGYAVSARVLDENGQGVADASVTVTDSKGNALYRGSNSRWSGRRSGDDDAELYSLGTLAPGSYTLTATWTREEGGKSVSGTGSFSVSGEGTVTVTLRIK